MHCLKTFLWKVRWRPQRYKLVFNVPQPELEKCKTAVFNAGAGVNGDYTQCCFTTAGNGQFLPGAHANPHTGTVRNLESVELMEAQVLCVSKKVMRKAVEALRK